MQILLGKTYKSNLCEVTQMENCIFCKIVNGQIPSHKIYEDEHTYAFLDISCDTYGHTLVIPKAHYVNVLDCDTDILAKVMQTVQKVANHYVNNCGFSGVNILNASGKDADQSVFHLHFHIIPRKADDGVNAWPFHDKFDYNLAQICQALKLD